MEIYFKHNNRQRFLGAQTGMLNSKMLWLRPWICIWCNQDINYGGGEKVALTDPAKTANHAEYGKYSKNQQCSPRYFKIPLVLK